MHTNRYNANLAAGSAGQTDRQNQALARAMLETLPLMPLRKRVPKGGKYATALLAPDAAWELVVVVTVRAPAGP